MPYRINKTTGATEYVNAVTGHTLVPPAPTPAPAQSGGFLRSAANALIPRTAALVNKAKAGLNLSALTDQAEEDRKKRQQMIERLIGQARNEADPARKSQLLGQARDLSKQGSEQISSAIKEFEAESGTKLNDKDRIMAEALGVAGELGTFLVPAGKLAAAGKTGKLVSKAGQIAEATTVTQRILKGAKLGAGVGAVSALTDPEVQTPEERVTNVLKQGVVGGVVGGAASAAFEGAFKAAQKVLGSDKSKRATIAKVFKLGDKKRQEYQASTGGADFEAELLAREGSNIAGMDYDTLVNHFRTRADEAISTRNEIISTSTETVKKRPLITKMKSLLKSLDPKEGNVGTAPARNQVQSVIDELSLIPDDEISLVKAERIKERLQNMGKEAFSPSKEPTAASEALAEASRFARKAIEKAEKNIKEANRSIQFYETAHEAISSTANKQLISSAQSVMRSLVQQMPIIAGAGTGLLASASGASPTESLKYGAIALALVGGGKVAGNKLMSPEVQTRIATRFTNVLEKQGVQNAGAMAQDISQEISKQLARYSTLTGNQQQEGNIQTDQQEPAEGQQTDPNQPIVQGALEGESGVPTTVGMMGVEQGQVHTSGLPEMVTIYNEQTGEEKQVSREELGQYGIATDAPDAIEGLPSKGEILAAMILDAQQGGKNITKLKTILDAYKEVEESEGGAPGKPLSGPNAVLKTKAETAVSAIDRIDQAIKEGGKKVLISKDFNPLSQEGRRLGSDIVSAIDVLGYFRTGAAITADQRKDYVYMFPNKLDDEETIQAKLRNLRTEFQKYSEGISQSGGAIEATPQVPSPLF